jgi:hypothetical protein
MLKVAVKIFSGIGCSEPNGCSIFFDKDATFHYFPSNNSNYFLTLNGEIDFHYSDGTSFKSVPLYTSNNWLNYQDTWKYDASFDAKVSASQIFASLSILNNTAIGTTLKIKKIENETVTLFTDKASALFVYGSNFQYNGNNVTSNSATKMFGYGNNLGSEKTHEIVATTPLTLMFLEKD